MNISGSGHIPAGEYNEKISISGSGRIDGNVRCTALSCSGSVAAEGSVACSEKASASGSCRIAGDLSAANISISGSVSVGGDIEAENELRISGSAKCCKSVKCTALICSGGIDIEGGIEAENARISGRINCGGLLNSELIDIELEPSTESRIGSIGGSEIKIYRRSKNEINIRRLPLLSKLINSGGGHGLTVDESIEGDVVAIECVKSPKVIGRVVAIGADCVIDLVQYSEQIEISPDAKVEKYERI